MKSLMCASLVVLSFAAGAQAQSDSQATFKKLKTLAGTWEGRVTTVPPSPEIDGKEMFVTFRVTSMGNTLIHEMTGEGRKDDPLTLFYLQDDKVTLTHYCDAGNRPRMIGSTTGPNQIDFEFLDVSGSTKYGNMQKAAFTFTDDTHHTEEWTFLLPGNKPVRARVELTRTGPAPVHHVFSASPSTATSDASACCPAAAHQHGAAATITTNGAVPKKE
jgi:hypothetical protein